MTSKPPRRTRPSVIRFLRGIDWVTLLTASPTWMAITRAFRPGAYPFPIRASSTRGDRDERASTERPGNSKSPSFSRIPAPGTMEPRAASPVSGNEVAGTASGGIT